MGRQVLGRGDRVVMAHGKGAGMDGKEQGKGSGRQEQGRGSKGTDSEGEEAGRHKLNMARGTVRQDSYSYPLAEPRLVEAHGDGTVVHPTGADRSAPQHHPLPKHPHFQHLSNHRGGTSKITDSDSEARKKTEPIDGDFNQAETKASNKIGDESEDSINNVGDFKAGDSGESEDIGDDFDDLHLAGTEAEQDPYMQLNDYIGRFRATAYATMKKCSAEEGIGVKNLCFLYQAETKEYEPKYQAETETEGIGDKDLSFL